LLWLYEPQRKPQPNNRTTRSTKIESAKKSGHYRPVGPSGRRGPVRHMIDLVWDVADPVEPVYDLSLGRHRRTIMPILPF
jgi:hypothetical protein